MATRRITLPLKAPLVACLATPQMLARNLPQEDYLALRQTLRSLLLVVDSLAIPRRRTLNRLVGCSVTQRMDNRRQADYSPIPPRQMLSPNQVGSLGTPHQRRPTRFLVTNRHLQYSVANQPPRLRPQPEAHCLAARPRRSHSSNRQRRVSSASPNQLARSLDNRRQAPRQVWARPYLARLSLAPVPLVVHPPPWVRQAWAVSSAVPWGLGTPATRQILKASISH